MANLNIRSTKLKGFMQKRHSRLVRWLGRFDLNHWSQIGQWLVYRHMAVTEIAACGDGDNGARLRHG